MFSIEEIEQIMEDTAEAIEKQREIDALLSGQLTQEDEEDVLKELEELVGDEDISDLLPEIPSTGKITILHVLKTIFLQINLFFRTCSRADCKVAKSQGEAQKSRIGGLVIWFATQFIVIFTQLILAEYKYYTEGVHHNTEVYYICVKCKRRSKDNHICTPHLIKVNFSLNQAQTQCHQRPRLPPCLPCCSSTPRKCLRCPCSYVQACLLQCPKYGRTCQSCPRPRTCHRG